MRSPRRSGSGWRCCPSSTCDRASAGDGCSCWRRTPRVEDGPGWWAARAAIETAEAYERKAPLRAVRTAYVAAEDEPGPDPALVNAALMSRDQIVSGLSERSMSVLDGLMRGRRQQDIADDLGISPSAVSQRVRAEGIGVVLAADELLRDL